MVGKHRTYDDDEQSKEINLLPSQVIAADSENNLQYNAFEHFTIYNNNLLIENIRSSFESKHT